MEQTFIMLKPDGYQRGLLGEVIGRFEKKGLKLVKIKICTASKELLERHYQEHAQASFFEGLIQRMVNGDVVPMVFQGGAGAVAAGRKLLEGIRQDYSHCVAFNICHASDSVASATREIDLWFN